MTPTRRFKLLVGVALALLALGNGVALARSEHDRAADRRASYRECVARNTQAVRSRQLLKELASVGDTDERALWKRWLREVPAGGIDCGKPPS